MGSAQQPYAKIQRPLAELILAVAGESVTVLKRTAPDQALNLKKTQEWKLYLEFLKILFNLVDRLAAFHLPIQERPQFMDNLEDTVTQQLNDVLAPALGPDSDRMEVTVTIGAAVAESRELYERFGFVPTEPSKTKDQCLRLLGERVAQMMQASGNAAVISAASVCASAAIPAIDDLFTSVQSAGAKTASKESSTEQTGAQAQAGNEIKLVSVMSSVDGDEVETRWGLHPRFRQDLKPDQVQELSKLMNRVTRIVGERYAAVAFSADWASWHQGHA
jgi:hypothetical protein